MMKRASTITLFLLLLCTTVAFGDILFSDRFETSSDWDGRTDDVSDIDSEIVGIWEYVWCGSQSDDSHAEISSSYGYSGRGLRFTLTENGCGAPAIAQESCLFGNDTSMSETTLYWGFRFRISTTDWGTSSSNKTLKMSRFYADAQSIIPGITGDNHDFGVYPFGGGGYLDTGYDVDDTDWHAYVFQFTAGTSNDGIIRLWVDGELEYENTAIDYAAGTLTETYFPMLQGNLSGGYNGPGLLTYWDDFIWATTKAEIDSFLGQGGGGTATQSGVFITGVSLQ